MDSSFMIGDAVADHRSAQGKADAELMSAPQHFNMGERLRASGRTADAAVAYGRAVGTKSAVVQCRFAVALSFVRLERLDEAESELRHVIALDPKFIAAYEELAALLMRLDRVEESASVCCLGVRDNPSCASLYGRWGAALAALRRWEQAAGQFGRALQLRPQWVEAHAGLAQALNHMSEYRLAESHAARAVSTDPHHPRGQVELGLAREHLGLVSAATEPLKTAVSLRPNDAEAFVGLGSALIQQLCHQEGLEAFDKALDISAHSHSIASTRLLAMNYSTISDEQRLYASHREWAQIHLSQDKVPPTFFRASNGRPLRVGYVSPDFRDHPVFYFVRPILRAHDRDAVEPVIFCDVRRPDSMTASLRSLGHELHETAGLGTDEFCELVRDSGIDVLIDLAGHTAGNRLVAFARQLAPVQVSYLGYPNTTGMPRALMQFRLTDSVCDPPGPADDLHTERLYRLPAPFICYRPPDGSPAAEDFDRDPQRVVFGSFNGMMKITASMLELWCALLRRVRGSHLMIKNRSMADEKVREQVRGLVAANGVDPERLVLLPPETTTKAHLSRFSEIDIALDTFPYNGTTTTCEAMWMGVPVVTLAGQAHRSRVGMSLLSSVGLGDLVARDPDEYLSVAAGLAADRQRLNIYRQTLRERMQRSPLMDARRLTVSLENAYRNMHHAALAGRGL